MHVEIVPNRNSKQAVPLRESFPAGPLVRKRSLANLSSLSAEQIEAIRRVLRGVRLAPAACRFRKRWPANSGNFGRLSRASIGALVNRQVAGPVRRPVHRDEAAAF